MKQTKKSSGGTSFHGTEIIGSVMELTELLGRPYYDGNSGRDKTNYEWVMETEAGDVFTVYDWKEYRPLFDDEAVTWHIGGMSKSITEQARMEIMILNKAIKLEKNRV